ncbi:MAG: rhomboid family intramembrane serine protease [Pseudomonadaceae bacterium]|nr:rhomboid family intramembrane serine protease [Pseudomonadaceae bacterium]
MSLIVLNVLVYCWQVTLSTPAINSFVLGYGMVPAVLFEQVNLPPEVIRVPAEVSLFTSLFLHADFWHLLGNMLFLWVFGDNIEDAMGHLRFAIFYILCGLLAGVAHAVAEPDSLAPLIGASGAVAGILGAYIILHPRVKVLVLVFSRIPVFLPARWLLFGWILFQFVAALNVSEEAVAWWAHIGGFAVGMALIPIFRHRDVPLFDKGTPH